MAQPMIQKGSRGAAVQLLQERLTAKGFHVKVDGDFGPTTDRIVRQFQAAQGLDDDGIVGSITWSLLMSTGTAMTPAQVIEEQRATLVAKIPTTVSADVRAVLEVAVAALGRREIPDGSNGGPELAEIVEGPGGDGTVPSAYYLHWKITDKAILKGMPPWCALFVCYALRIGLKKTSWAEIPFGNWFGGAQQIEDWAKKKGRWSSALPAVIPPGAIFTISREGSGSDAGTSPGAGHVGFVVCDAGDRIVTIEGNVSNAVGSHRRKKSNLRGVASWW